MREGGMFPALQQQQRALTNNYNLASFPVVTSDKTLEAATKALQWCDDAA